MSKNQFSNLRMVKAATLFFGVLLVILLIGGDSPLGVSFARDVTNVTQTVTVKKITYQGGYIYQRDFIGRVEARQTSNAGFEISGTLQSFAFDEGDRVKAGEALAELDTARLIARKNEAKASVKRAGADARLAAVAYNRFVKAHRANAVSAQEKDEAREARDMTAAALNEAKARLEIIEVDIAKSKLIAPFDGVVIRRMADEGAAVNAGQAVLEIQQKSNYDIRIGVTGKAASNLVKGAAKQVRINGERYEAVVKSVIPVRGQSRTVDVILSMKEVNSDIRAGDVARLPIEHETKRYGFWAPLTALKEGKRGLWSLYVAAETAIMTDDGDNADTPPELILTAERRAVEVHYADSERAYVSGSVKDGEAVIIEGAGKLTPGQRVRRAGAKDDV